MEEACIQYSQNITLEYSPEFCMEFSPNILGISHGNVSQILWNIMGIKMPTKGEFVKSKNFEKK